MAKVTKKQVLHVAKLSGLKLEKKELSKFSNQLSEVIKYFSELKEVETSNTDPTNQTTGLENTLREDKVISGESLKSTETLSGTENTHNGYFVVPMVLTERTDY